MAKKLKIAKEMTVPMAAAYITGEGENCPFCKGSNLEGDCVEVEGEYAAQNVGCSDCGQEWKDSFRRVSVTYGGIIFEPANAKQVRTDCLNELFRKLTSTNFVEVGDLLSAIKVHITEVSGESADV